MDTYEQKVVRAAKRHVSVETHIDHLDHQLVDFGERHGPILKVAAKAVQSTAHLLLEGVSAVTGADVESKLRQYGYQGLVEREFEAHANWKSNDEALSEIRLNLANFVIQHFN